MLTDREQVNEKKKLLRRTVAARRKACAPSQLEAMSLQIMRQILGLDEYRQADIIFAYMALPGEVQTIDLIGQCLKDQKRVAVPKVEGKEMRFYEICAFPSGGSKEPDRSDPSQDSIRRQGRPAAEASQDSIGWQGCLTAEALVKSGCLSPGAMGILEPVPAVCPCADGEEQALIIMPGVAFDRKGNRIGYGGGYYDRYLQRHSAHITVAAAFEFQIFDEVPHEDTDIRPRMLVTEKGIYPVSG